MAANLSAEEAREIILNGENDDELSQPDSHENLREKLLHLLDNFDGGPKFNHGFFRDKAIRLLIPVAELSQKEINDATDSQASRIISENYNPLPLLREESKYWLKAIYRRLGSRNRIRTPYYAEIRRDIPSEIFGLVVRVVKRVSVKEFYPPLCFHAKNNKAEVISFTTIDSVAKLWCLLSGLNLKSVKKHFKRSLGGGRKKGYKFEVLVNDTRDIAFMYKFSKQQLIVCFHYGEWNSHGFPQHY